MVYCSQDPGHRQQQYQSIVVLAPSRCLCSPLNKAKPAKQRQPRCLSEEHQLFVIGDRTGLAEGGQPLLHHVGERNLRFTHRYLFKRALDIENSVLELLIVPNYRLMVPNLSITPAAAGEARGAAEATEQFSADLECTLCC